MTISIEPLDPDELDPSAAEAAPPALSAGSLRILDQVFHDGVDIYEYRLEMEHRARR